MRIQHNIMAMNAYRNYTNNVSAMKSNLEKLSSGYKINRAGDDAAGLAISEKMRAQITGLQTAQKNAKDGISLVQTAEGALTEVHDMLNRMVELATQSANGTYDNDVDRYQLQKEVDQLLDEINRIADSANFNGIKLLDGSMDASTEAADAAAAAAKNVAAVYLDETSLKSKILEQSTLNDPTSATDGVGKKTILETDYADTGEPGFTVNFNGISHVFKDITDQTTTANNAASFTLNIGSKNVTVSEEDLATAYNAVKGETAKNGDVADSEVIAKALSSKLAGAFTDPDSNTYTVKLDGEKLVFTANNNLTTAPTRHYDVTINGVTGADVAAKASVYTSGALTQDGTAGAKSATALIKYTDMDGNAQEKEITFDSDTANTGSATKLIAAINADDDLKALFTAAGDKDGITLTSKVSGATVGVTSLSITTAGADTVKLADGSVTTKGADAYKNGTTGYANYGTEVTVQAGPAAVDQLASTTITFTKDDLQDGTKIRLGDQEYTIAIGEDSAFKDVENAVYVDGLKATDDTFLDKICTKLAEVAANNETFTVSHQGTAAAPGKIGVKQLAEVKDSTDMSTMDKLASYLGISQLDAAATSEAQAAADEAAAAAAAKVGKSLTLQIGDTADDYNQLKVNIQDMHAASLGLDKISIADQDSAAAAVDAIKAAINKVSDVRGTLGATQNRLDHTINNLSVMTENIQDAESTIRDVDVAEEMMAYTKNNILIQSAQAMLAQANQVPQGVLQLLQ